MLIFKRKALEIKLLYAVDTVEKSRNTSFQCYSAYALLDADTTDGGHVIHSLYLIHLSPKTACGEVSYWYYNMVFGGIDPHL